MTPPLRSFALGGALLLIGEIVTGGSVPFPRVAIAQGTPPREPAPTRQEPPPGRPGIAASAELVRELQDTLARAVQLFEAQDLAGVLAHVSDQYRTGPLTKTTIRAQLLALFHIYEAFQARVRIDEVRLVGAHAWVYSSGDVSGRLPLLGHWVSLFWWQQELEVARREAGGWRLFGYQQ